MYTVDKMQTIKGLFQISVNWGNIFLSRQYYLFVFPSRADTAVVIKYTAYDRPQQYETRL